MKNLFSRQRRRKSRSCCLPRVSSHFLHLSCPFLSLGDLLPPSPLTRLYPFSSISFPSLRSFLPRASLLLSLSFDVLSFIFKVSINVLLRVCVYAFSPISFYHSYNLHINAEFAIRLKPDDMKISLAPDIRCPLFYTIYYIIYRISFSHCFTTNSYVLRYIYFFFCSSPPQDILCVK